jgi:hypothetical protein
MAKFVLLHHGGSPPEGEQARDEMMAAMSAWMEALGDALVDTGSRLGPPKSIGGSASDPANGYMIVEAPDHDAAVEIVNASPMASDDSARLDVHEAFSM